MNLIKIRRIAQIRFFSKNHKFLCKEYGLAPHTYVHVYVHTVPHHDRCKPHFFPTSMSGNRKFEKVKMWGNHRVDPIEIDPNFEIVWPILSPPNPTKSTEPWMNPVFFGSSAAVAHSVQVQWQLFKVRFRHSKWMYLVSATCNIYR